MQTSNCLVMESLFSVGDKVICVDSHGTNGLVEGKKYTVKGIHKTSCCGVIEINVGVVGNPSAIHRCSKCRGESNAPVGYKLQTRFIKPDTDAALSDQITEALNEDLKVKL